MTPETDIVIPVHNAAAELEVCVDSLYSHTEKFRLIIVDDFSGEEAEKSCRELVKRDKRNLLIRTQRQSWFTRASNLGLRMVRTPWCVLLNSDCIVDDGWLEELYAVRDEVSAQMPVGLVGSVMSAEEPRRWAAAWPSPPDYVTGHCWLLNVAAISDISVKRGTPGWYLDETRQETIHIHSDNELCHQLTASGYYCIKSFKALVGHHGGKSWGHDLAKIAGVRLQDVV